MQPPADELDAARTRAAAWFEELRDRIAAAFEALEDAHETGPLSDRPPGRFERVRTTRRSGDGEGGGGVMSVMRGGRVFEKVGVNVSTVHGRLGERAQASLSARKEVPGLDRDPRFWASGVSLVAHMQSPKCPAVHLNTRMFWTPQAWWFGGGTDLNPVEPVAEDTEFFHAVLRRACEAHDPDYYPRFREWADDYFLIRHRGEPRGAGGIFFDDLCTGDWDRDFGFVQDIGAAFIEAWLPIAERRRTEDWTDEDRTRQLVQRGHYAEFNLLYDRGTRFGLETGHDPDAVLMSLPPLAAWP